MAFLLTSGILSVFELPANAMSSEQHSVATDKPSNIAALYMGDIDWLVDQSAKASKKYEKEALRLKEKSDVSQSISSTQDTKLEKYVFISLAMPEQGLMDLLKQSKKEGFIPVLRGFKQGSYKETAYALNQIITKTGYGVIIDPELYKEFAIKVVPTYVVTHEAKVCQASQSCMPRKANKLSGNVTPEFAMQKLKKVMP